MPLFPDGEYRDTYEYNDYRKLYIEENIRIEGVKTFGWQSGKGNDHESIPWHYHKDCFEFHYLLQGTLSFVVGEKEYNLKIGDVFVTVPNELHRSGEQFMMRRLYWFSLCDVGRILNLPDEWSENLLNRLRGLKNRVIPTGREMGELLGEIFRNITSADEGQRLYASSQMAAFLYKLTEYDGRLVERSASKEISSAFDFIEHNKKRGVSLEETARECNLSLSHFKRRFKNETGTTPALYIQKQRIKCAKELLKSGMTVTETAYSLDFSSSNYFSVVFRRITSMTPTEYIKKHNAGSGE